MKTKIGGYDFDISDVYKTGKKINEAEASALNRIRAVSIGSIFRSEVKDATRSTGDGSLSKADYDRLQKKITEYDKNYSLASGRGKKKKEAKKQNVTAFARLIVNQDISGQGMTIKQYKLELGNGDLDAGNKAYNKRIREVAANPELMKKISEMSKLTS